MKLGVVVTNTSTGDKFLLHQIFDASSKEDLISSLKKEAPLGLPVTMLFEPFEVKSMGEIAAHYSSRY